MKQSESDRLAHPAGQLPAVLFMHQNESRSPTAATVLLMLIMQRVAPMPRDASRNCCVIIMVKRRSWRCS